MLVQFALMVFALMAMVALVIDVGLMRVTQSQMQTAADAAALEGIRLHDVGVPSTAPGAATVNDAYGSDCQRRASANRLVRWTFDDDFDPLNGDAYQFGAGPIIDLTGDTTNLHALQTASVRDGAPVYKPDLQMNQRNQVHGDMVSGRFCYNADPSASEGPQHEFGATVVCTEPQHGSGVYARNDFNPNLSPPSPPAALPACPEPDEPAPNPWPVSAAPSALSLTEDSAFLVRLRRSNELQDFVGQTDTDVASAGPSVPLLFGKGSTIAGDDPTGGYSARRDGVSVRATAIAEIRPAVHVGLPQPSFPGATPFTLIDTFVQGLNANGAAATINPGNGRICRGTTCPNILPNIFPSLEVGRFVGVLANADLRRSISTVGQAIPLLPAAPAPLACTAAATTASGYGAVYSIMASGTARIIGFARLSLSRDLSTPARAADPCAVVVRRGVSLVAATNATASFSGGLPLPPNVPEAELAELLDKHFVRAGRINYAPLLAAALAR